MIIRSLYCLCFTVTLGVSVMAQHQEIDSLLSIANHASLEGNTEKEITTLIDVSSLYAEKQQYTQSIDIARDGLVKTARLMDQSSENLSALKLKAKLLGRLGYAFYNISTYDSAQYYYLQSLSVSQLLKDTLSMGLTYNSLSITSSRLGQTEEALKLLLQAAEMLESIDEKKKLSAIYNNIGNILSNPLGEYERARRYFQKANAMNNDEKFMASRYNNIAMTFDYKTERDSALFYLLKAEKLHRKNNNQRNLVECLNNISNLYATHNEHFKAREYLLEAETIGKLIGYQHNLSDTYFNLSNNAMALKNFRKALVYARESLKLAQTLKLTPSIKDSYWQMGDVYKNLGNADSAYSYMLKFHMLNDSIFREQNKERIASMERQYQTEKKEQQINSLRQEASINQLEIKQKNMWLIGSAITSVLLLVAGSTYIGQRKLRFKQQTLTLEQKLLRTQMNPHFLFNSLMCIQHFIYQNNPAEAGKYLSKYARLMRLILENSRLDFVPIHKEVEALQYYFELQRLRFKNKFEYNITVDPEITEDVMIPPMFAQPFIENSLEHGILQKSEKGIVNVKFEMSDNRIHFSVTDNGVGIKASGQHNTGDHQSLATKITRERLNNLYKGKSTLASMKISELRDDNDFITGTQASFYIPYSLA
ncbi:histidine kinase [Fulvivirga ulvae]|uniref:histidine kinase n=1 Tax=Fulvivirga ulvae TaxID=2904245 RepID=UPI001F1B73E7|nr:histidine kinase [Fulvivirga ulvae]UII32145.1 histidine kinase [Fulvivirga ulvae]